MSTLFLIVIDGLGVGAQEDSHEYGDQDSNTLLHVIKKTGVKLPHFEALGLGNILALPSVAAVQNPEASFGKMRERSAGKDSTTGHWEIAGIRLQKAFPTYPKGFPPSVLNLFSEYTGTPTALCNMPYSGTQVIDDFGSEHLQTGSLIVYTSADSVFQIACHTAVAPIEQLYEWCKIAREQIFVGEHAVGRVIARPFSGKEDLFERITEKRKDFSLTPPEPNLPIFLQQNGISTHSIGKIIDLFANRGFHSFTKTKNNSDGLETLLQWQPESTTHFVFVNLIDTDQLYGHRNDPEGYARSLEEIDYALPELLDKLQGDDMLIITGDHGNDPTTPSTDHSREFVPLLIYSKQKESRNLGTIDGFDFIARRVCHYFDLESPFGNRGH